MKFPLGYVGVGLMGGPMVKRLTSLGWAVRGYDIVPERSTVGSAAEAARGAQVVLLNLPTNEAVEDAVFGPRGLIHTLKKPQLVVDFSTIPVDACRAHSARVLKETGCRWVDAPVSGGPPAVEAGTLTVMAGGEAADLERLAPLMKDIAGRCTHMGPVGAGLAAKMINQLIVGVGTAMLGEAVALCEKAGIDARAHPRVPGRRLCRQQRDEGLLAADGRARLRAARLRAAAAEGPGDGERVGRGPEIQDPGPGKRARRLPGSEETGT